MAHDRCMPVTSCEVERDDVSRMILRDSGLLGRYIRRQGTTQASLARSARCSRQFVHQLVTGTVTGCTPPVAERIEEHLNLIPGTLFVPATSRRTRRKVGQSKRVPA